MEDNKNYKDRMSDYIRNCSFSSDDKKKILKTDETSLKSMFSPLEFSYHIIKRDEDGTDRINLYTVKKIAFAVIRYLCENCEDNLTCVISHDDRKNSLQYEKEMIEILTNHGIKVYSFTTCQPYFIMSYGIKYFSASFGIAITADDLDDSYNGIQFFNRFGSPLSNDEEVKLRCSFLSLREELLFNNVYHPSLKNENIIISEDNEFFKAYKQTVENVSIYRDIFKGDKKVHLFLMSKNQRHLDLISDVLSSSNYDITYVLDDEKINIEKLLLKKQREKKYSLFISLDRACQIKKVFYNNDNGYATLLESEKLSCLVTDHVITSKRKRNLLPPNTVAILSVDSSLQNIEIIENNYIENIFCSSLKNYVYKKENDVKEGGKNIVLSNVPSYNFHISFYSGTNDTIASILTILDTVEYFLRSGRTIDAAIKQIDEETFSSLYTVKEYTSITDGEKILDKLRNNLLINIGDDNTLCFYDFKEGEIKDFKNQVSMPFVDTTLIGENALKFELKNGFVFLTLTKTGNIELKINVVKGKYKRMEERTKKIISFFDNLIK